MQQRTQDRAQALDSAQVELWQRVSSSAEAVGTTLQNLNTDIPGFMVSLESIMEHIRSSTKNLSIMHTELEEQIIRNNEQLLLQQSFIGRLKQWYFAECCLGAFILLYTNTGIRSVIRSVIRWIVGLAMALTCELEFPFRLFFAC
jgi:hypothetical protein